MPRKSSASKRTTKKRAAKPRARTTLVKVGGAMALAGLGARKQHSMTIARTYRAVEFTGILGEIVTDNGGAQEIGNFSFALNKLPNFSEFTKLYEEYCIKEVKITFMPNYNANVQPASGIMTSEVNARVPKIGFCANYTGGAIPATGQENPWLECEAYEQHDWNQTVTVTLKPKVLGDAYSNAISNSYVVAQDGLTWIPVTYADVLHYGLNWRVYDAFYNRLIYGPSDPCGIAYITYTIGLRGPQ